MKTTIEIPEPLVRAAKEAAAREGTTLKALIERGLRTVLEERIDTEPFKLRDAGFSGNGLPPEAKAATWDEIRDLSCGVRTGKVPSAQNENW